MKKFVVAFAVLLAGSALSHAENPYVGQPADYTAQDKAFRMGGSSMMKVDYTATASVPAPSTKPVYSDGSAYRFGDASPSSFQKTH